MISRVRWFITTNKLICGGVVREVELYRGFQIETNFVSELFLHDVTEVISEAEIPSYTDRVRWWAVSLTGLCDKERSKFFTFMNTTVNTFVMNTFISSQRIIHGILNYAELKY